MFQGLINTLTIGKLVEIMLDYKHKVFSINLTSCYVFSSSERQNCFIFYRNYIIEYWKDDSYVVIYHRNCEDLVIMHSPLKYVSNHVLNEYIDTRETAKPKLLLNPITYYYGKIGGKKHYLVDSKLYTEN